MHAEDKLSFFSWDVLLPISESFEMGTGECIQGQTNIKKKLQTAPFWHVRVSFSAFLTFFSAYNYFLMCHESVLLMAVEITQSEEGVM